MGPDDGGYRAGLGHAGLHMSAEIPPLPITMSMIDVPQCCSLDSLLEVLVGSCGYRWLQGMPPAAGTE